MPSNPFTLALHNAKTWWQELTAREVAVYCGVLLAMLAAWGFVELADEMLEGETQGFDDWVLHSLRLPGQPHQPIGPHWLQSFFLDVTALGSGSLAALIGAVVIGALLLQGRRYSSALISVSLFGTALITTYMKQAFGRQRPPIEFRAIQENALSFPSGHSFVSAVLYLTIGALLAHAAPNRAMKIYIMTVAVLITLLVGFSRVFLGVHYATDVLGGWCAGILWATICMLAGDLLRRRRGDPRPSMAALK